MLRRLECHLRPGLPRPHGLRGVSCWAKQSRRSATIRSAAANGTCRNNNARRRLTPHSSQLAVAAPRWDQPRGLAGVHQALRTGRVWLRAQAGPARRRRGRHDAGRDAFGFDVDRPARLRSQPGNIPRLAVYDHPQQSLQFPFRTTCPPSRIWRHGDESHARIASRRRRRLGRSGKWNISDGWHRSRWSESKREDFRKNTWRGVSSLTAVEGSAAADVARQVGMSAGAIYVAKSRVLARLKDEVETMRRQEEEVGSS